MFPKAVRAFLLLALFSCTASAGIRGPGEYAGVVVFDHWDTCYLYEGVYLMYVSDKIKERLRPYAGQTIRINATEVYQPMNPGDGLITEFRFLGLASDHGHSPTAGLVLTITPAFEIDRSAQFVIEIKNTTGKAIKIAAENLAPTLLGEKNDGDLFSPSDGKSDAKITRWGFPWAKGEARSSSRRTSKGPNGEDITVNQWFGVEIDDGKVPFGSSFVLAPGQSRQFKASILASPGDYELLCGYSIGRDYEERISNKVFFSIDDQGVATPNSESKRRALANSPLAPSEKSQTVAHPREFSRWAALARALATLTLAFVVYRGLYRT